MRRLRPWSTALALLALTAQAAWVAPYTYRYEMATCPSGANPGNCIAAQACAANSCSGTAPTGQYEGMTLVGVASYRLRACAAAGQTLSGAGSLQAYWRDDAEGVWVRNPGLDVTVTGTGLCQVFPDFIQAAATNGRVRYVASGVTVSLGDVTHGLDVLVDGYSGQR